MTNNDELEKSEMELLTLRGDSMATIVVIDGLDFVRVC